LALSRRVEDLEFADLVQLRVQVAEHELEQVVRALARGDRRPLGAGARTACQVLTMEPVTRASAIAAMAADERRFRR